MNAQEHILTCLAEEGAEITHITSKCLRFGLDDRNVLDPGGPTNRERLVMEVNDLLGVCRVLVNEGVLPKDWEDFGQQVEKIAKLKKFMKYAESKGTIP
jgi:hypothetical protein